MRDRKILLQNRWWKETELGRKELLANFIIAHNTEPTKRTAMSPKKKEPRISYNILLIFRRKTFSNT